MKINIFVRDVIAAIVALNTGVLQNARLVVQVAKHIFARFVPMAVVLLKALIPLALIPVRQIVIVQGQVVIGVVMDSVEYIQ
jgi:hypothetical protein